MLYHNQINSKGDKIRFYKDDYNTMREFWTKVLNYIFSMFFKPTFKQIKKISLLAWLLVSDGATLV